MRRKTKKIKELEAPLIELEQRSSEWFEAKWGRFSASKAGEIMPMSRGGYSAKRVHLKRRLVTEILEPYDDEQRKANEIKSAAMEHGNDNEEGARKAYEWDSGNLTVEAGIYLDPKNERICASPDGVLIGEKASIEIKCPYTRSEDSYHGDFLSMLSEGIEPEDERFLKIVKTLGIIKGGYYWQMQMQMNCLEVDRVDFVVFDPRVHQSEQLVIIPVYRNQEDIDKLIEEAEKFLEEVDLEVENRRKKRNE